MELHAVADDVGHLDELAVVVALDRMQDAPLHGLEAVFQRGDGAVADDVARVGQEVAVHQRAEGRIIRRRGVGRLAAGTARRHGRAVVAATAVRERVAELRQRLVVRRGNRIRRDEAIGGQRMPCGRRLSGHQALGDGSKRQGIVLGAVGSGADWHETFYKGGSGIPFRNESAYRHHRRKMWFVVVEKILHLARLHNHEYIEFS